MTSVFAANLYFERKLTEYLWFLSGSLFCLNFVCFLFFNTVTSMHKCVQCLRGNTCKQDKLFLEAVIK